MSGDDGRSGAGVVRLRSVRRSPLWWFLSKWSVLLFGKIWFRLRVEHADRLPATGPVLLVANHASYLDPPLVGITANRWIGFLAQAGLGRFAPMRWWLRQVGVTLIDRHAPSKAALRLIADCLRAGEVVGLFPEGTRSSDGRIAPFRNGVEFLVRRTGAAVVPIGIDGSFRALPRHAWLPRPRQIVVRYGQPWTSEQVLAEGGIEALRRQVAELARCAIVPVSEVPAGDASGSKVSGDTPAAKLGGEADTPGASAHQRSGHSGSRSADDVVDSSKDSRVDEFGAGSSSSASAGGGA